MSLGVKKDQMTAKERMAAVMKGEPYDRVPCGLFIGDHSAKLIGAKVSELHTNLDKLVEAELAAHRIYDTEGTRVSPGLCGFPEALGCKAVYPDDGTPYISEFAIQEYSDLDRIERPDPKKSARLPMIIKAAEILVEKIGDKVPVGSGVVGPFTVAGNTRGTEKLMRDLRQNPEFVHRLLRLTTDTVIDYVKEIAKLGVSIGIGDPTASGTLISRKHFIEFALPYLTEVTDAIIEHTGRPPQLHICGNTKGIWKEMADSGAGMLSLDDVIDLEEAKKTVGHRVVLMGNIRPTQTMYLGTPADVEENAKECLRKAYDTPKGYVLALGCGLPLNAPSENVHAVLHSARKYGQYPLNPANFN